jgi:hypothetical protein
MKLQRSTKCSLKFSTENKRAQLREILAEYGKIVNFFIQHFWVNGIPSKGALLKPIVDLPTNQTWATARLRKVAAREAIDMCLAAQRRWGDKAVIPTHRGKRMCGSSSIARLENSKDTPEFDAWLILASIGNKIHLSFPIKFHRHFNRLSARGRRQESYIITEDSVQLAFEIETGPKKTEGLNLGLDTGMKVMAATSDGGLFGQDVWGILETIKRCAWGSKRQKSLRRSLKQRMDEIAIQIFRTYGDLRLLVVENLKNMNKGTKLKRRLSRSMRRSLGAWVYRYWLNRVERGCEDNRVVFRSVPPAYTSQRCPVCGHTERGNRPNRDTFCCLSCGHTDHPDVVGGQNILDKFLTGPYGAGFQPSPGIA